MVKMIKKVRKREVISKSSKNKIKLMIKIKNNKIK